MDLFDLNEFFRLSAILNLQLSATSVGRSNIASIILGRKVLSDREREILLRVLEYLDSAYGPARRRLGSVAVLHPLRASALLSRALEQPTLLDILTELLHDKLEDLTPNELGEEKWQKIEESFQSLRRDIDPKDEWFLMERLDWLTRRPDSTYFQYIGRLLDHSKNTPELVRVKLADRLDNTLDMRIDIEDPIQGVDFFATMFQIMFVNSFKGYEPGLRHPAKSPLNGAQRLYQLFKNTVLMTLIRQRRVGRDDPAAMALFSALASASMKEAQRTALHIFGYHETDLRVQRELLMEAMRYAQSGGMERITLPTTLNRLDGFFSSKFEQSDPVLRAEQLALLYPDKSLMVEACLAFIVLFLSFLNDPDYYVGGIDEGGIQAIS